MIGSSFASQSRTASWLASIPRSARISLRSRSVSLKRSRQSITKAMMWPGTQIRFSTPALGSFYCRPAGPAPEASMRLAVTSRRSVTAPDPQQTQFAPPAAILYPLLKTLRHTPNRRRIARWRER